MAQSVTEWTIGGTNLGRDKRFFFFSFLSRPDLHLGLSDHLFIGYLFFFLFSLGVNWPGLHLDHSPPPRVEVNSGNSRCVLSWRKQGPLFLPVPLPPYRSVMLVSNQYPFTFALSFQYYAAYTYLLCIRLRLGLPSGLFPSGLLHSL